MENCPICLEIITNDSSPYKENLLRELKKFKEDENSLRTDAKLTENRKLYLTLLGLREIHSSTHCIYAYMPLQNEHFLKEVDSLGDRMIEIGKKINPEYPLFGYFGCFKEKEK